MNIIAKSQDKEAECLRNYEYDRDRFTRYSSAVTWNADPVAVGAELISAAHSVEKGLALEDTRAGFAVAKIEFMLEKMAMLEKLGANGYEIASTRGTLQAYVRFHDDRKLPLPESVADRLREIVAEIEKEGAQLPGGWTELTRAEVADATAIDYERFVRSRYSIRHFTGEEVTREQVRKAVSLAIKTPRTCNREMRHVYAAHGDKLRDHLLQFHRGTVGFGHKLGAVLIIAVDLRQFDIIGERNQCWVDGGLFAMSLVYALHSQGLGTCMLNWSTTMEQDKAMRDEFGIPDHHVVVTMLGVGHLPERLAVAYSPSPDVDEVLKNLELPA